MQGWDQLPDKFKKNVEGLHEMNPEFEHKQWDEKSLYEECLKVGPECAAKFKSFEILMSKVDFGRDVILYNYGGISVDTDMVALRPIRDTPHLNECDFIISSQTWPFNLFDLKNTAVIICTAKNPLMKTILDTMIEDKRTIADFSSKETYINSTTGPFFINSVVNNHRDQIKILDYKYYEPCSPSDPYCTISSDAIMDHQHELSWMNPIYKTLFSILYFVLHFFWYIAIGIASIILYLVYRGGKSSRSKPRPSKIFK